MSILMKHPDRAAMIFHPIDVEDAIKDGWTVDDGKNGDEVSESEAEQHEPQVPAGASIAGGNQQPPAATGDGKQAVVKQPTAK